MNNFFSFIFYSLIIFTFWISFKKRKIRSVNLFFYHTFLGSIFVLYTLNNPSDTKSLFFDNDFDNCSLILTNPLDESNPIACFTYLLKTYFIDNFGLVCSIFSFIGFLGINIFYNLTCSLRLRNSFDHYLINSLFFIPSISFWSSINYKDSIVILSYAVLAEFIYYISNNKVSKTEILKVVIASILTLIVRPYTFFFLILSITFVLTIYLINQIINERINIKSIISFSIALSLIIPSIAFTSNQLSISTSDTDLNKLNFELIKNRSELSKKNTFESNSYIDKSGLNKTLFILFGPYSFLNIFYFFESLTGFFFLLIAIRIFYFTFFKRIILYRPEILFSISLISLEFIKIQLVIFNFGIIARQRTIIYLLLSLIFFLQSKYNMNSKIYDKEIIKVEN